MSITRYPEYKSSGSGWLADVPSHWDVKRLRRGVRLSKEKTERRQRPVALENIESWSGRFRESESDLSGEGVAFEPGDVLFGKLRPYLAKALCAEFAGEAVGDFHVLRPLAGIIGRFLQYQLLNPDFISIVDGATFGAKMPRVGWDFMGDVAMVQPPLAEQLAICRFLDRETARIDKLIEAQDGLIELLNEKRQAAILHAVTKGVDPHVPLRASGVEWMGEIPGHWNVTKLKHTTARVPNAFVDGPFGSNLKSEHFVDNGAVYVIESNFATRGQLVREDLKRISEEHFRTVRRSEVKEGDIVIAKIGAQFGKASILPSLDRPAVVSGNSMKLTVDGSICTTQWVHLQLLALKASGEIDLLANGSAQPALSLGAMSELKVTLAPLDEQMAICSAITDQVIRIDALIRDVQAAIALLLERRCALVSAAVTGQIDVRGLVPVEVA